MATVPLRAYINEIESIIEQKQTEEAIAHCRQILHYYPKHIDTYRMLGKAYLESQRYGNAADILQRVLSAVPDDFISHVGMSIIREDEKNLDAAIWHMERAFETQPYNAAIQGELRRLYGLRDGMQPPKVQLTRGALARMYVKGDLYQQAIAELRSAIAEDPQRFDLQILLARMYAQSNQDAMAIETCGTIINKLPYCLEANRILAQLLEKSKRTEEVQNYKKRVQELDPYEAYVGPNEPTVNLVPDQAVRVEQLVWDGGPATAASDQPEWATSVGVDLGSTALGDELPDWMSDADRGVPELPSSLDAESATQNDEIPDFLKEAGWVPSTGAFDESQLVSYGDEAEAESAEMTNAIAGDIPDWLQQMAPPGAIENPDEVAEAPADFPEIQPETDEALTVEGSLPDWLQEAGIEESEEGGVPEWLTPAAAGAAGLAAAAALFDSEDEPVAQEVESEIPDWLSEMESEHMIEEIPLEDAETTEDKMPDWLQEMAADEEIPELSTESEIDETEGTEIPDWLQEMEPEAEILEPTSEEDKTEAEEAEMPDWLQEMAADEAASEPSAEDESVEEGGVPDWLAPAAAGAAGLAAGAVLFDSEDELAEESEPDETEKADIPDWLQEMETEAEILEPTSEEDKTEAEEAEMPDWLQEIAADETTPEPSTEEESIEEGEVPDWLAPAAGLAAAATLLDSEDEPVAEAEEAEIPDSLQEMAADKEIAEPSTEIEAEGGAETEIPDWLQEIEPEAEATELADTEAPDWLQEMAADEVFPELEAEGELAEEGEVPDWLAPAVATAAFSDSDNEPTEPEETKLPEWLDETAESEPFDEAAKGEVPEWLEDAVEADLSAGEKPEGVEKSEIPDWLSEAVEEDVVEIDQESVTSEIPDWIEKALESEESETLPENEIEQGYVAERLEEISESVDEETRTLDVEAQVSEADLPDWFLEDFEETDEAEDKGDALDALKAAGVAGAAVAGIAAIVSDEEQETQTEGGIETSSDWIQETIESEASEAEPEESADEDEVPDWLSEAIEEEVEETLEPLVEVETELAETEEIPEWLTEAGADEELELIAEVEPASVDDELPEWLSEPIDEELLQTEEEVQPISDDDEGENIPEWLREAMAETPEPVDDTDEIEAEIPDWIQEVAAEEPPDSLLDQEMEEESKTADILKAASIAGAAAAGIAAVIGDEDETEPDEITELPTAEFSTTDDSIPTDFDDADAAMAWLENLAAQQGVSENELLTSPEERSETPPDWVQEVTEEESDQFIPEIEEAVTLQATEDEEEIQQVPTLEPAFTEQEPADEITTDDLPDWIQEIADDSEEPPEELEAFEEPTEEQDEIPAWLNNIGEDIPTIAGDTEIPAAAMEAPPDDIPDWLQDIEVEGTPIVGATSFEKPDTEDVLAAEGTLPAEGEEEAIETLDFEDSDAAMAWLEGLAAKQGVSEDELLTSPEERSEIPLDWVQEAAEEPEDLAPSIDKTIEEMFEEIKEEVPVSEVSDTDIPDWITEPIEAPLTEISGDDEEPGIELPAFMQDIPSLEIASDTIDEPVEPVQAPETEIQAGAQPTAEDDFPDFEDVDAAMAWLEGLAAKQGVSEEELLTSPEERTEAPPDWVQKVVEPAPVEDETTLEAVPAIEDSEIPDWILEAPESQELDIEPESVPETPIAEIQEIIAEPEAEVELPEIEAPPEDVDFEDVDAAMAWLEGLAAKQGVSEEELLTSPEERTETPPDWVKQTIEEDATPTGIEETTEAEATLSEEEIDGWMAKVSAGGDEKEPDLATLEPQVSEIDDVDAAMAWLESLAAKQGVPEEELLSSPEERTDTPPVWVQDAAKQEVSETEAEIASSQLESEVATEERMPQETETEPSMAPPSWLTEGDVPEEEPDFAWIQSAVAEEAEQLLDLNQASLIQLERLPGIGFRRAQSITAFRSQHGDFLHLDELLNVPGMDIDTYELLKTRVYVTGPGEQTEPQAKPEPTLFAPQVAEPDDAAHEQQIVAQNKLNEGNISEAMADYDSLIKKSQRLNDIIEDLNLAAEKYPEEITIVQTLGDAYMQANRLQEAINAYTKAEKLLK